MRDNTGAINGASTHFRMGNGAGGWLTKGDAADDGYVVAGGDTTGPLVRAPSGTSWTPLCKVGTSITASEMDSAIAGGWTGAGTYGVSIAATNSQVIYMAWGGWVWKTTDRGATVTRCAGWTYDSTMDPNPSNGSRLGGRRVGIDPAGTAVVAVCSANGLWYTTNSGTTFTKNTSVPLPTNATTGRMVIAYDRTSSVVSSQTQTVYVYSSGNGVYKSTTGVSGTFSLVTGSGSFTANTMICSGGKLHIAGDGLGGPGLVRQLTGTTWTSQAFNAHSLASNPAATTSVWAFDDGGSVYYSSDSGVTYTSINSNKTRTASDVPWLAWTNEGYMSNGDTVYNPNTNTIWFFEGIGVWEATPQTTTGATWAWQSRSLGIDQLVSMHISVSPTRRVITTSMDRSFFALNGATISQQASSHGPNRNYSLNKGGMTDYAGDDSTFWVGTAQQDKAIYVSTDNAVTWSIVSGTPLTYLGGNIAVSTKLNWVYVPTNRGRPQYTLDGGATWTYCTFNATYDAAQGFHGADYLKRVCVVADKANAGTFYIECYGDENTADTARDIAMRGVWKTTNGGVTWTRVYSSALCQSSAYDYYHGKLAITPGNPTHLTWSCGPTASNYDENTTKHLRFSKDGAVTWNDIPGMNEPNSFAWGVAAPGKSYPTLYAYGWVSSVRGLYRMTDFDPTALTGNWTLLDRFPLGRVNTIQVLAADPVVWARLYFGLDGEGFGYTDYTDTAHGT